MAYCCRPLGYIIEAEKIIITTSSVCQPVMIADALDARFTEERELRLRWNFFLRSNVVREEAIDYSELLYIFGKKRACSKTLLHGRESVMYLSRLRIDRCH